MTIRMLIAMSAVGLLLTAGCATAPDKPTMKEENATAAAQPTPDLRSCEKTQLPKPPLKRPLVIMLALYKFFAA